MLLKKLGVALTVACLAPGLAGALYAQGASEPAAAGQSEESAKPAGVLPASSAGGYTYTAAGRRDPFVSLLLGRGPKGPARRQGLLGQLISEIDLVGIAKDAQGYLAMLRGSDQKTYFVRVGAELADGKIIDIATNKVTFREEIKDPFSLKPFRDITKSLTPGGEEE